MMPTIHVHVHKTKDAGKASASQVNNGLSLAGEIQQLLERKGEGMDANEMYSVLAALGQVARVLRSAKTRDADENALNQKVRAAYKKLTDEFAASGGNRGRAYQAARKEFIDVNYEFHKAVGRWHPLASEMD